MRRLRAKLTGAAASDRGGAEDAPQVLLLQSADPDQYAEMLALSRSVNELYARRHGFQYVGHLGVLRGCYPWHAAFNRILLLGDLVTSGYRGWVFYLDADAYVVDLAFDLKAYLREHRRHWLIALGLRDDAKWDINNGVFLINLADRRARRTVRLWRRDFLSTSEEELSKAPRWGGVRDDQVRLQQVLRTHPAWLDGVHTESHTLINYHQASFVRQAIRAPGADLQSRLAQMRAHIEAIAVVPEVRDPRHVTLSDLGRPDERAAREMVSCLYQSVLGRPSDATGLETYTRMAMSREFLDAIEAVIESFMASDEFARRIAALYPSGRETSSVRTSSQTPDENCST